MDSRNSYYVIGKYHLERTIYIVRAGSEAEAIEKITGDIGNEEDVREVRTHFPDFSCLSIHTEEVHVIDGAFNDYEDALYFAELE